MQARYEKNQSILDPEEQAILLTKRVAVVGLGGLGGYAAGELARLGFGYLTLIDPDRFVESNLNRQLFATTQTLGKLKVEVTREALRAINPEVVIQIYPLRLDMQNGSQLLDGAELVLDCLDSVRDRLVLGQVCREIGVSLIHGAVGGWYGQVSFIAPGDDTLEKLFSASDSSNHESYSAPAFTPALVASLQVAEAVKYCLGKGALLKNKLLYIDMLQSEMFSISIGEGDQ